MIKGLYFKLNTDKQIDKDIYNFFNQESKEKGIDKISLLFSMMCLYISDKAEKENNVKWMKK